MDLLAQLHQLAPHADPDILRGIVGNWELLAQYGILPGNRQQMFLAQVAHESDGFRTTHEYASGRAYEGREDLGNTEPGDGVRFKGRGLIQLTGRANYTLYGKLMGEDLVSHPELAGVFPAALWTACIYWQKHGCNELADKGYFGTITRRINGGLNGYSDRCRWFNRIKALLTDTA